MAPKETPFAISLLSSAHSPDIASKIYHERILHRPLHLAPNNSAPNAQQVRRSQRLQKKQSRTKKNGRPKPLSAKQVRSLGLYNIPKSAQKYNIYASLHKIWIAYIQEVLWDGMRFSPVNCSHAAKLCSADFHGAELEVIRSRCVSRVGIKGIVVKDTRFVFELITCNDNLKIVPKEGTVFRFVVPFPREAESSNEQVNKDGLLKDYVPGKTENQVPDIVDNQGNSPEKYVVFELHGDQFRYRATDRANRKFKPHFLPNL